VIRIPLPGAFFAALVAMVVAYLVLIEIAKWAFYRAEVSAPRRRLPYPHVRHLRRRAAQFSHDGDT
jgi:Mg2+-importing ATPase